MHYNERKEQVEKELNQLVSNIVKDLKPEHEEIQMNKPDIEVFVDELKEKDPRGAYYKNNKIVINYSYLHYTTENMKIPLKEQALIKFYHELGHALQSQTHLFSLIGRVRNNLSLYGKYQDLLQNYSYDALSVNNFEVNDTLKEWAELIVKREEDASDIGRLYLMRFTPHLSVDYDLYNSNSAQLYKQNKFKVAAHEMNALIEHFKNQNIAKQD